MQTPKGSSFKIRRPDDFHLHLRDSDMLSVVTPFTSKVFGKAIIMPNLTPPVTNAKQAQDYKARIEEAVPKGDVFLPLMTLYLTDKTTKEDIQEAKQSGFIYACKLYPAGATTNAQSGVTDIKKMYPVFEEMQKQGLILCIHGEVTDADVFDREAIFIDMKLRELVKDMPDLKIVLEHITTTEGVEFVSSSGKNIAATITPQHLLFNRTDMLGEGICPHMYCKPILKAEEHRRAVLKAATSESPKFFAGTDSAPHLRQHKEVGCGCAGCFTAMNALELYVQAFDQEDMWDGSTMKNFEDFMSTRGTNFYGLDPNEGEVTLTKESQKVQEKLTVGDDELIPFMAGQELEWKSSV